MKFILALVLLSATHLYAQVPFDLDEICGLKHGADSTIIHKDQTKKLLFIDDGFCNAFSETKAQILLEKLKVNDTSSKQCLGINESSTPISNSTQKDKWKIRFYASHSFTTYFNTDLKLRSTRYNVDIKNYEWAERGSRNFFEWKTLTKKGNNILQWIDEPTNTFTISLEKDGHEFFLSAFHPKFLQADNQVKYMLGTIDGTAIDGFYEINRPFDGYNQEPGEMELVQNRNTHKQMIFELGYGKRLNLAAGKWGSLVYTPALGLGVTFGENISSVVQEGLWWDFDEYKDSAGIQGFGGTIHNRIEYNIKNEKLGIFYDNRFSYYKQNHGFLDGTQEYDLKLMGHSIGLKLMIFNPNKKKRVN